MIPGGRSAGDEPDGSGKLGCSYMESCNRVARYYIIAMV